MSLLSGSVQPPLLSVLSSTSSPNLTPMWTKYIDPSLPSDSCIISIADTDLSPTSKWDQRSDRTYVPKHVVRGPIIHPVIHIQSPAIQHTYIQAGTSLHEHRRRIEKGKGREGALPLGLELPWCHLQIRQLGKREFVIEFGVVDARGREGVVRCSTFKKSPTKHPHRSPPLIHLPLQLRTSSGSTLTPWLDISIDVPSMIPLFQSLPRPQIEHDDQAEETIPRKRQRKISELPSGRFASISYIRVYANCRLRRIWFKSQEGEKTMQGMSHTLGNEFGLFAAQSV